jgi:hypothetical protein
MDEREHLGRNRVPDDPATPEESATIHYAIKSSDGNQGGSPYYPRPFASATRPKTHWSRWNGPGTRWMCSSVGRIEMTDELRRQLREVEQALVALDGGIAVRRECVGADTRLAVAAVFITTRCERRPVLIPGCPWMCHSSAADMDSTMVVPHLAWNRLC